mgnify:FL=1
MQKTNNQTKTGQFKSNEQTLRHRSTKDEYKHYNKRKQENETNKNGRPMSKEQTETQEYNRKEQKNNKNSARAESRHHYKRAQEYTPHKSYP